MGKKERGGRREEDIQAPQDALDRATFTKPLWRSVSEDETALERTRVKPSHQLDRASSYRSFTEIL